MKRAYVFATALALSFTALACESGPATGPEILDAELAVLLGLGGPNPRPQAWVDGELFDGVVTPTSFKPTAGNFDELYTGGDDFAGFRDGVRLISESGPGDTDYNGGRWHVNTLKEGVDLDKYIDADGVDDLDLDDFEPQPVYFECPLLPRRGRR